MSPAALDKPMPESVNSDRIIRCRFDYLRGVQWRIDLGILPSSSSPSIDDLRRLTADSRRRYAGLRRRLLIDPHISKDGANSPDLAIDNPLSQNPDSTWGRFFRNAELEKTVDQDLSRLYPEHGNYFQTSACQGMLRRILLLWCLRHPECGYRQGMHELLAPLLYVLHVDVERLSEVRKQYEDHFTDKFDGLSFHENDLSYNFDFKKYIEDYMEDEIGSHGNATKVRSLHELDPEIQTIVLLSDAYGSEGELGIVLSEKFMEHDAYCMFDALMNGANGSVAMADFFSPSPAAGSHSGLPPVIEASAALYHLLSIVDPSLHSHLVELGVEPQYFALRWLRVLFGREFLLKNLLLVWDVIFSADNNKTEKGPECDSFGIFSSDRGALISAIAVSMILHLRSSLLATENATICLQRLLNFPENIDLNKLIDKARSLQTLALESSTSSSFFPPLGGTYNHSKSMVVRGHTLSSDSVSPKTPLNVVPDSYWEEKWRVLHKAEDQQKSSGKKTPTPKKGWSEKVRLTLSRTISDLSPPKVGHDSKVQKPSVRRRLLTDLSRELGFDEDIHREDCDEVSGQNDHDSQEVDVEAETQVDASKDYILADEDRYPSGNAGSEDNSSVFSDPSSPLSANNCENDLEKSSTSSNLSTDESDDHRKVIREDASLPASDLPSDVHLDSGTNHETTEKSVTATKERKLLSGKFQWFWKFGRNNVGEEISEKGSGEGESTTSVSDSGRESNATITSEDESSNSIGSVKADDMDQNMMSTLRNLGHSMLEHIQVIESVFQQDRVQVGPLENFSKNVIVGKGQVTAMTALKELRKISNLLSEM